MYIFRRLSVTIYDHFQSLNIIIMNYKNLTERYKNNDNNKAITTIIWILCWTFSIVSKVHLNKIAKATDILRALVCTEETMPLQIMYFHFFMWQQIHH
jgi:hypothetical protein